MGCGEAAPPVLGISMGGAATDAGLLALEQREEGATSADLFVLSEWSNRAEAAIRAADSLLEVPGMIAVVGHPNSAASLAASQIYNRAGVVQIAPHSSASLYSEAGPYSFRMVPSDDRQGPFLAERLAREYERARVAVLYENDDYGRGLRRALLTALDSSRFPVMVQIPHVEGEVDPSGLEQTLGALEEAKPDLVVWIGRGSTLQGYLPGIRERMGPIPVWGSDATALTNPGSRRTELWTGVRYVDFLGGAVDSARLGAFEDLYRRRFGRLPSSTEILTYDAVSVLLAGLESGARTGSELRSFLVSLGRSRPAFQGISGPVTFDADGNASREYQLRRVVVGSVSP